MVAMPMYTRDSSGSAGECGWGGGGASAVSALVLGPRKSVGRVLARVGDAADGMAVTVGPTPVNGNPAACILKPGTCCLALMAVLAFMKREAGP